MPKLEHAIKSGADIKALPKLVEVNGLADIVAKLETIATMQREALTDQYKLLISAIDRLVEIITEKEIINEGTDLTELIATISALKQEVIIQPEPYDWDITFERDNRSLMKSGIKLRALPRMLN